MSQATFEEVQRLADELPPADQARLLEHLAHRIVRLIPRLDPSQYVLEPQISEDELERRRTTPQRMYSTAEVLAHLESL